MLFALQIILSLAVGLLGFVALVYLSVFRSRRKCDWMPHAPRWPLLGSALEFGGPTETLNVITRLTNNPSKTSYVEIANVANIVTRDYDLTEFVLSSNKILNKSPSYQFLVCWLGTGLLIAPGPKWKQRRKMITPAFHFSILEQFVDVFNSNSKTLVEKLTLEALDKDSVDIYSYVTACALDTICESAMGVNIHTQNDENQDYVLAVKEVSKITMNRVFSAWKIYECLFRLSGEYRTQQRDLKVLHGLTNSVIEKKKRELQAKGAGDTLSSDILGRKRKLAFLDLLLNCTVDGRPLSQEDIREEVDTFMFEGHDTTSSGIASALFLLANHPEVQKKVRDEQKQIFGQDRDRETTYQDLQDMKYLELVIKETLRLYPPVPLVQRCPTEDTTYKGHIIPKDIQITLCIYGINRDPDYYEAPNEFKPERFLEISGKYPYSYIPFSAGPRNCIGQKFAILEMKSIISKIVRHFELCPTDPPHEMLISTEVILKSINGVRIKVKKCHW